MMGIWIVRLNFEFILLEDFSSVFVLELTLIDNLMMGFPFIKFWGFHSQVNIQEDWGNWDYSQNEQTLCWTDLSHWC